MNVDKMKAQVDAMLLALLGSDLLVQRWWHGQNWHFNLEKPYIVWESDPKAVWDYVVSHVSGDYH